jgi:hypothetical protein
MGALERVEAERLKLATHAPAAIMVRIFFMPGVSC